MSEFCCSVFFWYFQIKRREHHCEFLYSTIKHVKPKDLTQLTRLPPIACVGYTPHQNVFMYTHIVFICIFIIFLCYPLSLISESAHNWDKDEVSDKDETRFLLMAVLKWTTKFWSYLVVFVPFHEEHFSEWSSELLFGTELYFSWSASKRNTDRGNVCVFRNVQRHWNTPYSNFSHATWGQREFLQVNFVILGACYFPIWSFNSEKIPFFLWRKWGGELNAELLLPPAGDRP